MQMHLNQYDLSRKEHDTVILTVIQREVQRRWQATSWGWKRKLNPDACNKWTEHNKQSEIKATLYSINLYFGNEDTQSKQTVKALKDYLKKLNYTVG